MLHIFKFLQKNVVFMQYLPSIVVPTNKLNVTVQNVVNF